jgi:hypothetical protein
MHMTVSVSDPLRLAKNFVPDFSNITPTTNSLQPVNRTLMKSVLSMMPALTDISRLGKMRDIYPLSIFHVHTLQHFCITA